MTRDPSSDNWLVGDPYERYMGRWSRRLAPKFLAWLKVAPDLRWLDVGCGTGALSSAILAACSPASVVGIDPSEGFLERARQQLGDRVVLHQAAAGSIPLDDDRIDASVSALVLNFVPEAAAALREMTRVTVVGGTVAACVWDYAGRMDLIRLFWDTATALDPGARALDEGARFALCHPDALSDLFKGAGLQDVEGSSIEIATPFVDFDDYWSPFLGGQGPAPAYAMALDEVARTRLRDGLRARIEARPGGGAGLAARAWAVRGTVAA